jgi:hypothetical protein
MSATQAGGRLPICKGDGGENARARLSYCKRAPLALAPSASTNYTKTRTSCFREAVMKNVTISMDDDLYQRTRVRAAQTGLSVSRYLARAADSLNTKLDADEKGEKRSRQLEALERILAGPMWDVTENGRMPTSEERNARR